jgi:ATP-dependent Clp protease ATP-binding subunit ClpA
VFGQDEAIEVLSSAIKLSRAGLRDPDKPIGNYLFSGPTGVGKTEVARQLASIMGIPLSASTCRNIWSGTRSAA